MKTAFKTWFPTKYQNLYRHKSDVYYARLSIDGKLTWRSLKTDVLSIARKQLETLIEEVNDKAELSKEIAVSEKLTGEDATRIRMQQIENDPSVKGSTRHYWQQIETAFNKSWPEFAEMELRKATSAECQAWAGKCVKQMSPTRFNNTLGFLKSVFGIAVKNGARRTNPAEDIKRTKVHNKDLSSRLPNKKKFAEFVVTIRKGRGRYSGHCADFVEGLAYTGMRIGETKWIEVRHCDFTKGEILVEGTPEDGTKNHEFRRIPMIPAARTLFQRVIEGRKDAKPTDPVFTVHEAQKSMERAAVQVGIERITHHDLRHFFATICIESGVDIPTVSKWLGHKDGGALAMKVYGHLRNEHSLAAASRVSFAA